METIWLVDEQIFIAWLFAEKRNPGEGSEWHCLDSEAISVTPPGSDPFAPMEPSESAHIKILFILDHNLMRLLLLKSFTSDWDFNPCARA